MKINEDYKHITNELFEKVLLENGTKEKNRIKISKGGYLEVRKKNENLYSVWNEPYKNIFPPKLLYHFNNGKLVKISVKNRIIQGILFYLFLFYLFIAVVDWDLIVHIEFFGIALFFALLFQLISFFMSRADTIDEVDELLGIG